MTQTTKKRLSFSERAHLAANQAAKELFHLMEKKQSNLGVACDVATKKELLKHAESLGPYITVFKTHIDIIDDFDEDLVDQLQDIAHTHQFLIFEDRKFADIGNTVKMQYSKGIYKIAHWAHLTNAHPLPGPGIIDGLKEVGLPLSRGLLLLAQMSSKDTLYTRDYTHACVDLAVKHADFAAGFICQEKLTDDPRFIHMTPGVQLSSGTDNLGQQYNTPDFVIREKMSDVIIVGRGIIHAGDPVLAAKKYQEAGWAALS